MAGQYFIRPTPGVIELWSTVRLPFEPRGWLLDMRNHLRESLLGLSNQTSSGRLHTLYCAADDGAFVDIENVLIYNVGGPALRSLTTTSLGIERGYRVPPPPPEARLDGNPLHYHRYSQAGENPDGLWESGQLLGEFADVPVDTVEKPAPVWKAIRAHAEPPNRTAAAPQSS